MLFNSLEFLFFIIPVFIIYWSFSKNRNWQNGFIVLVSYLFYGWWDWRFLFLIAFSSLVDYGVGLAIPNAVGKRRKQLLWVSIGVNLGVLLFFKYFNFFVENFVVALSSFGLEIDPFMLSVILPVGISFYTFQTMSYSLDIYHNKMAPTKNAITFFAYVSFFPQLVAGPIERAINLIPQFEKKRKFNYHQATDGLRQILWGLFTKIVIADNCAPLVNDIFGREDYSTVGASTLIAGAILFAFQIYGDFSGYSNIALGLSKLLGFNLMVNFRTPYFSRDIAEFWRRWHISLSTWFRDYLYIPLGGSQKGRNQMIRNTFIIFLVSGFWHGANWTFIIWGLINALYFLPMFLLNRNRRNLGPIAENKFLPSFKETLGVLLTFGMTCVAWIFFRADDLGSAINYISSIFTGITIHMGAGLWLLKSVGIVLSLLLIMEWVNRDKDHGADIKHWPRLFRWIFYYGLITIIVFKGNYQEEIDFIYFQF